VGANTSKIRLIDGRIVRYPGMTDHHQESSKYIFELWGCGFNQFNQIDDTGKDHFTPVLVRAVPLPPDVELGLDLRGMAWDWLHVCWAGWADLLCCCFYPSS